MRRESGQGEFSDEAVCNYIGMVWSETHQEDSEDYCRPQWDGVASCIPSAPINQSAVLPCIEFYHDNEGPQYFDTSCESNKVGRQQDKLDTRVLAWEMFSKKAFSEVF